MGALIEALREIEVGNLPEGVTPIDAIEARLAQLGGEYRERGQSQDLAPVTHHFTPGLYAREIHMPEGLIVTTETHKTEHPYLVSQGRALVYVEGEGWYIVQAPAHGVTKPGTRRLLIVIEDTIWTTFHATEHTDVATIEAEILEPRANPLLAAALEQRKLVAQTEAA